MKTILFSLLLNVFLLGLPVYADLADFSITRSDIIYDSSESLVPSVVQAANGDLVCCFGNTGDAAPGGTLQFVRSSNGGQTWSSPYLELESKWGQWGALSGYLYTAPNGDIVMAVADYYSVGTPENYVSAIEIYVSTDNGLTFPSQPNALVPNEADELEQLQSIMVAGNGDWLIPGYLINRSTNPRVHCGFWRSTDQGVTWTAQEIAFADAPSGDPAYKAFNEVDIVKRLDGSLLSVARTDQESSGFPYANGQLYSVESFDHGATWTTPLKMNIPGHSPSLIAWPDGTIMLGCRRLSGSGNWTSVYISEDGINFQFAFDAIDPRPNRNSATGYPTFAMTSSGDVYMAYYAGDTSLPWPSVTYCAGNVIHYDANFSCGTLGYLMGDINLDCRVNITDFSLLTQNWSLTTDPTSSGAIDCTNLSDPRCVQP